MQVGSDVRQSDVHGRDVEDDHQLRDKQHREEPTCGRLAGGFRSDRLVFDRGVLLGVLWLVMHDLTPFKLDATV